MEKTALQEIIDLKKDNDLSMKYLSDILSLLRHGVYDTISYKKDIKIDKKPLENDNSNDIFA